MKVTAQDLYNYTKCAHRVFLDSHGNPAERAPASEFMRLLWEMGLQTERQYLSRLGDLAYEDLQSLALAEAIDKTAELMGQGVALIFQGALQVGDFVGRPDLLLRRDDARSKFGSFYYEAIDIKAGRGWELRDRKCGKFKQQYAYQILFYREILRQIQGVTAPAGRIINVDGEIEEFDPASFEGDFQVALAKVQQLVTGAQSAEPVLSSVCGVCRWLPKCRKWVEDTRDPSGLFSVGAQKYALKEKGLATIDAIATMDVERYLKEPNKIPRMGRTSLERMKRRARVMIAGKPEIRSGYAFPEAREEIYFDIEDDPTQGLTYLFGVVVRDDARRDEFRHFVAHRPQDEEATARRFWDFLRDHADAVFYVYSHKERTTLRALMKRYHLDAAVFERYCRHEFDLYQFIVDYSDWPAHSYSIKQIAKLIGFRWRDTDPSGANSIAWYNEYYKNPGRRELLQRIVDYNEDDCRAMMAIKEYFEHQQP